MKTQLTLILVLAWSWFGMVLPANASIQWRISIKFVLGPGLQMPAYGGLLDPFMAAELAILSINTDLEIKGSPYRLVLIEAIAVAGIDEFYAADVSHENAVSLDANAKADKDRYCWRDDAINVYINGTSSGTFAGYCSFPGSDRDVILIRADASTSTLFHEIGHFFNLRHTHSGSDYDAQIGCDGGTFIPGNSDGCDDTLPDLPCFDRDDIAMESYGQPYESVSNAEQVLVDNTWLNLMSYHKKGTVITPDQWARVDEATTDSRNHVVGPRHWFVDWNNGCASPNGSRCCAINGIGIFSQLQAGGGPFPTVFGAMDAAQSGDLLRIRQGTYPEGLLITKALTLQAEDGPVILR
jgi:hypothetical protein